MLVVGPSRAEDVTHSLASYGIQQLSWKASLAVAANRILRRFDAELVSTRRRRRDEIWRPLSQLVVQPARERPTEAFSAPFLKGFQGRQIASLQEPVDFAVVMSTMLRPTITDAIQSIFDQQFGGSIQMLIGIDGSSSDLARVEQICRSIPERQSVLLFYPGYSTSRRHGGLHATRDGGSLRTILSYLANSRYIAYLDDDNWWSDDHLSTMYAALSTGAEWVYALRWFVHPGSRRPICRDEWESVGPGRGFYGGWVDPNCLAIDKIACEAVLRWWSIPTPNSPKAMDADRNVFRILSTEFHGAPTGRYSVFYEINETDTQHSYRLSVIGEQRYSSFARETA
jgi:hypothetical protein